MSEDELRRFTIDKASLPEAARTALEHELRVRLTKKIQRIEDNLTLAPPISWNRTLFTIGFLILVLWTGRDLWHYGFFGTTFDILLWLLGIPLYLLHLKLKRSAKQPRTGTEPGFPKTADMGLTRYCNADSKAEITTPEELAHTGRSRWARLGIFLCMALVSAFFAAVFPLKLFHRDRVLTPVEVFQKVAPSVFVVEALGQDGKFRGLGSAVALSEELLATNCHVVQGSSFLRVTRGNKKWSATLVGAAPDHDLCLLNPGHSKPQKWDPVTEFRQRWPDTNVDDQTISRTLQDPAMFRIDFPDYAGLTDDEIRQYVTQLLKPPGPVLVPLEIVPSSALTTGQRVYAVGSPEGLELTFSEGVISALRDNEGVRIIQTSAAISPGSSGGGLFDDRGRLVGITTFQSKEGQSLNFALPCEWVRAALDQVVETDRKSSPELSDSELESNA